MNWFLRTLAGAVISGVGWKLGSDAYEVIKKRMQQQQKKDGADADAESDAAGATITGAADGDGDEPTAPAGAVEALA